MADHPWDTQDFAFTCPHCQNATIGEIVGRYVTEREHISKTQFAEAHLEDRTRVVLVYCTNCYMPVLFEQQSGWGWNISATLWPPQLRTISDHVPASIRAECEEARGCFHHAHYKASVVMVRRTLEGICQHQGSTKKVLHAALSDLEKAGKLDKRLVEWANELRLIGNAGAHYSPEPVSREDAADALAFLEALLDYLYVLTAQFEIFKKRRETPKELTFEQPSQITERAHSDPLPESERLEKPPF